MMRALLLFLFILLAPVSANARETLDFDHFARISVQHEGRVKPLDTFARASLEKFSGRERLNGQDAAAWLAQTLFDPARALHQPVFRILRPDLAGLPLREGKLYSYAELAAALQDKTALLQKLSETDPRRWSKDQIALADLQEKSILYAQLLRSFSLLLPLRMDIPDTLRAAWNFNDADSFTLRELRRHDRDLRLRVERIVRAKGSDIRAYSDEERALVDFAYNLDLLKRGGQFNALLRVIPSPAPNGAWSSPWQIAEGGAGTPEAAGILRLWEEAAKSYLNEDAALFEETTRALAGQSSYKTDLEIFYNSFNPLTLTPLFYLLSFLFLAAHRIWARPAFRHFSCLTLIAGLAVHSFAIAARILILARPPVGTLYESILFVSAMIVFTALILEARFRNGNGLFAGSVGGLLLLFTARAFTGGDTMQMLVAVLNTNFWLATHVLCITTGYAFCLLTAFFAHLYLFRAGQGQAQTEDMATVKTLGLIALLFTAVGTILGGIWADQSWGRFWGWDPKENGALLIVLWLAWLYHGSLSGHLRKTSFAAGMAALAIIVALAWFGVNLLNVGLHSYGFITGVAAALGAFCTIEIISIGYLCWRAIKPRTITA